MIEAISRLLATRSALAASIWTLGSASVVLRAAIAPRPLRHQHSPLQAGPGISVVLPVLNEVHRVGPCLHGLALAGPRVREILVVDCGSTDSTREVVMRSAAASRVRWIDAPPPPDWNGKAWALRHGALAARHDPIVAIDADVRPAAGAIERVADALAAHRAALASAAVMQDAQGLAHGAVHASLLASLVARTGVPGTIRKGPHAFANGQLFATTRERLARGMLAASRSRCEDVTLARWLASRGHRVAYLTGDGLGSVSMYGGARDALSRWPRSLQLADSGIAAAPGIAQWAGLALAPIGLAWRPTRSAAAITMLARLGLALGVRAAYPRAGLGQMLGPLADIVSLVALASSAANATQPWRGRVVEYER